MVKSCYIHIPFCEKICSYCDFCKLFYNEKLVDQYLEALEKEIITRYQGEVLETIYIGGGTPSSLNSRQLWRLFEIINKLEISEKAEFTVECNFANTTKEKLEIFKKNKVNRLSFGLETINKKHLELLERFEEKKQIVGIIKAARECGFNNINVDLMYALPGEKITDLQGDLEFIKFLNVEHISCYSLMIEEHTKLFINGVKNISEDKDFAMYNYICRWMRECGYQHYEISNYAREGFQSRHNLVYWDNKEYYGFGLGASYFLGNRRGSNTKSITKYLKGDYLGEVEVLEKKDFIFYEIMLNLRKAEGIDLNRLTSMFGVTIDYKFLLEKKLVKVVGTRLFILEDKWYVSNEIIATLLEGVRNE